MHTKLTASSWSTTASSVRAASRARGRPTCSASRRWPSISPRASSRPQIVTCSLIYFLTCILTHSRTHLLTDWLSFLELTDVFTYLLTLRRAKPTRPSRSCLPGYFSLPLSLSPGRAAVRGGRGDAGATPGGERPLVHPRPCRPAGAGRVETGTHRADRWHDGTAAGGVLREILHTCSLAHVLACSLTYLLTDSRICLSLASLLAGGGGENLGRRGAHRGTLATTTRGAEGAQGHAAPSCSFMCPRLQPYGTRL